jgi:hypothetical protein
MLSEDKATLVFSKHMEVNNLMLFAIAVLAAAP